MAGMPEEQIKRIDVRVGQWVNDGKVEDVMMRTTIVGKDAHHHKKSTMPKLVWVHGFAGSGALFFQVYKSLSQNFLCYFVDVIGMGESSRPQDIDIGVATAEENLNYYLDYFEIWRDKLKL